MSCENIRTSATSGSGPTDHSAAAEFTQLFSETRATRPLALYICFLDRYFSFCTFSFHHCVCCSLIYGLLPSNTLLVCFVCQIDHTMHRYIRVKKLTIALAS
jgi:hypothetical protein